MTDELVERLRSANDESFVETLCGEAADRIEQLTAERDKYESAWMTAEGKLSICEKYRDAYAELDRIGTKVVCDLEDKLAKAVEALRDIARQKKSDEMDTEYDVEYADWEGGYNAIIDVARITLATLKGESHD